MPGAALRAPTHDGGPARLVYLGSPEIAVAPLDALVRAGHEVALVVTNPDRRRGRRAEPTPTPVKRRALELGLPVTHDLDDVLDETAALGVVVAYGHLIGNHILEHVGLINLHFSLLPRWRGAAPVERAILAGDERTGVCLMQIVEALDEGDVFGCREVAIGDRTVSELRQALVDEACELLLSSLAHGLGQPEPQAGEPSYAAKLRREDFELDFDQSAEALLRVIRLERAFTTLDGRRLGVIAAKAEPAIGLDRGCIDGPRVGTGDGTLVLETVQPEGRKAMPVDAWLRGARIDGARLGD